MGRPSLPIGTAGKIRTWREANGQYTARCSYRDYDGITRTIDRTRDTRGTAERALKEAIRDRGHHQEADEVTPGSRVSVLAEAWWKWFDTLERSPGTKRIYRDRLDNQILPAMGALHLRELSIGRVERFLRAVEAYRGPSVAKTTRSVLSGMCAYAARRDALDRNPVSETSAISVKPKKGQPRALTPAEARQLRAYMTYDDEAVHHDVPDLISVLLGSGLRIGEALALVWDAIDLEAGTLEVRGTVVRIKGKGLIIKPEPKTEAGYRTLVLPSWCIALLRDRQPSEDDVSKNILGLVFPSTAGTLRDPDNVQKRLKEAHTFVGMPELTSHWYRKTVATLMDRAGLTARAAADQLGHARPSITQDVYFGRGIKDTGAAAVLEVLAA
jgi:integrase